MRRTKIFASLAYWPGNRTYPGARIACRSDNKCSSVTLDASFVSASSRLKVAPALALFVDGREVARQAGAMAAGDIVRWVESHVPR